MGFFFFHIYTVFMLDWVFLVKNNLWDKLCLSVNITVLSALPPRLKWVSGESRWARGECDGVQHTVSETDSVNKLPVVLVN